MTAHGLTPLHFIPQGARMNSEYYIDNILSKIVKPAFDRISNAGNITEKKNGIFQQDGARCHTSATTIRMLNENIPAYIQPADWPPNSPDLFPIENIWSILTTSVYRDPEPKNVVQLRHRLRQAWKIISEQTLLNLIKSLPDRLNDAIKRKGDTVC